jgi:hypothetical protein
MPAALKRQRGEQSAERGIKAIKNKKFIPQAEFGNPQV